MDYQTLNLLFRCNKEFSHKEIRSHNLSDTECMICSYIYSHSNCSQDEVAVALRVDKTTIAKALLNLEQKKYVIRTSDYNDKRKKLLQITDLGYQSISDLMNLHNNWLSRILTCLTQDEQLQFENYCERLLMEAEHLITEQEIKGEL